MEYWIWLSQLTAVGPTLQKKLLHQFATPEQIYRASHLDLLEVEGIGALTAKKITKFRLDDVKETIKKVEKLRLSLLTSTEKRFEAIFSCVQTPILFYYKGQLPPERGVAIVGARRCTNEAKQVAEELATYVAKHGYTVVSGLAKGIDSYAHTASLKAGGKTIAIVAGGVDICYPTEHIALYENIISEGGAIVSAFPPGKKPHPKSFVERNAHISAWSEEVVIVQASEKSGSLTTARFAKEQGRNLYTVPYSIYVPEAKGSNLLLQQGAKPYLSPQSLKLRSLPNEHLKMLDIRPKIKKRPSLSPFEAKVLNVLTQFGSSTIESIANQLQVTEFELTSVILTLEMKKLIKIKGRSLTLIKQT